MNHLSPALIAPCGMNCGLCLAYLREKNRCPGCRAEDAGRLHPHCARCRIRNCPDRTGEYCYDCAGYPCARLKQLDKRYTKYRMSMLDNLHAIQERGIGEFIEQENSRWTCPALRSYPLRSSGPLPAVRAGVVKREVVAPLASPIVPGSAEKQEPENGAGKSHRRGSFSSGASGS